MHEYTGRAFGGSSLLRRLAVGGAVVGLVVAGNAAIGLAGDDGRDGSVVPGTPTDTPTPVVDESNARDAGARPTGNLRAVGAAVTAAPVDNGRGGADPAVGPLPVPAQTDASSSKAAPSGAYDTDTGLAPTSQVASRRAPLQEAPVDQDVPGAPTASAPGKNLPALDTDG